MIRAALRNPHAVVVLALGTLVIGEQDPTRAHNDYVTAVAECDEAQDGLLRATGASAGAGQERG